MNTKLYAFLILLASFTTTTLSAWAQSTTWAYLQSPLTEDTTIKASGSIAVEGTIDLAGHRLYLEGLTGLTGAGSFTDTSTDTANPGELHLILTGDISAETVGLTGNMRLVKSGTKTLTMAVQTTSYTGGTVISNGTLKIGTSKYTLDNVKPLGAAGSSVIVCKGGKFDVNGKYGFKGNYDVILDGGTVVNQAQRDNPSAFNPRLTMTADSTFSNSGSEKKYGFAAEGSLGGRVLTIEVKSLLYWQPKIADGTVMLTGTKELSVTADTDMRTVNFDESGATLNLNGWTLSVSNYIANLAGSRMKTEGSLNVYGVFTPNTDNFFPPTMQDGSTIDLSAKEGPWAAGDTAFADGATIAIEVGERTDMTEGSLLVTWKETEYNGRTFNLTSSGVVKKDLALQAQAGGLVVVSTSAKIPTAVWKGGKSADALDPENWDWRDAEGHPALPDGTYVVEIAWDKLPELNWPETDRLNYASLVFTGDKPTETVVLNGDRDWRGLGALDVPFALDLNGHKLYIVLPEGSSANETEVTSTAEGGELHATVATDKVHDNTSVALTGNLSLIKEGPGAFVATKYPQTYTGETIVNEGTLRAADGANVNADSTTAVTNSPFGTSRTITVGPEGVLDPRGSYSWGYHTVNLDGGAISNTIERTGLSSDQYRASMSNPFNPDINLMQTSVFATEKTFNYQGKIFPNGNKLRIWIANGQTLVWNPNDKSSADIEVVAGGFLRTFSHGPVKTPNCSLVMAGGALYIGGVFEVSNYWASSSVSLYKYDARQASDDEAVAYLKVYGSFRPETDVFFACSIQDGASIDLSGKTSVWSTKTSATAVQVTSEYKGMKSDVTFAEGAKVTIDVGSREFRGATQIVSWSEGSKKSAAGAKFVLSAAAKTRGYRLTRDENGLYIGPTGFVLLIQ